MDRTDEERAEQQRRMDAIIANEPRFQDNPPPLTDEELAVIELDAAGPCYECNVNMWGPRIFAALRAARAEAQSNRVEADAMGEIAREWEAEVERLREDARESYVRAEEAEQALQRFKATT